MRALFLSPAIDQLSLVENGHSHPPEFLSPPYKRPTSLKLEFQIPGEEIPIGHVGVRFIPLDQLR